MKIQDFSFDRFLIYKEEKDKALMSFVDSKEWTIPMVQRHSAKNSGALCRYNDKSLEIQLDFLDGIMNLKSDIAFTYLEPWVGVGVFADAFGCPVEWSEHDAPQTRYLYERLDDIKNIKYPKIKDCEMMQMVMDRIRYFKEKTGGQLDISLTDTQSPNDNASLILDSCEFFMAAVTEPETVHPLLKMVTDLTIEFTEMQMEAIGSNLVLPGHIMISGKKINGISISDDNMAVISPLAYENTCLPYNNILSKHFGGISIHSCGNFAHNSELLLKTDSLFMVDCAVGSKDDPTPNNVEKLKKAFLNSGVIIKARAGCDEIYKLEPLIDPSIRLIVQVITTGNADEKNRQYDIAREEIEQIKARKNKMTGMRIFE